MKSLPSSKFLLTMGLLKRLRIVSQKQLGKSFQYQGILVLEKCGAERIVSLRNTI